jgi:hypothetical protein
MKVRVTFIVLKKDNNISPASDQHLKVYLDDDYLFPFKYISTKNEYETLKEISEHYLSFEVLNNEECEVIYIACIPQIGDSEKTGSFYTLPELSDIGIELKKNYERAIFKRGKSPVGW